MEPATPWLQCITVADLARLKAEQGLAKTRYTLQTSTGVIVNTKERFFEAANQSLPLDPPRVRQNWDALEDSLFGGVLGRPDRSVDILWPFANDVARVFLVVGVKFFKSVTEAVEDHFEYPTRMRLLLICSNESSKQRLDAELWAFK